MSITYLMDGDLVWITIGGENELAQYLGTKRDGRYLVEIADGRRFWAKSVEKA